jgi:hypothetical protein
MAAALSLSLYPPAVQIAVAETRSTQNGAAHLVGHTIRHLSVIVFSHGSANDPIDNAHTLEDIAARGFVVAAPYHVNNTQDDVRIDHLNAHAVPAPSFPCRVDRPAPCSRDSIGKNLAGAAATATAIAFDMADRVRDISQVLDSLNDWFGHRVDVSRVGLLAHSRGTAILDRQTLAGIVIPTGSSATSGRATQYCPSATFTTPVDIGPDVNDVLKAAGADPLV